MLAKINFKKINNYGLYSPDMFITSLKYGFFFFFAARLSGIDSWVKTRLARHSCSYQLLTFCNLRKFAIILRHICFPQKTTILRGIFQQSICSFLTILFQTNLIFELMNSSWMLAIMVVAPKVALFNSSFKMLLK